MQQFIESSKTQYVIQKGTQASNEYIAIITPYVNQIVSLESQLKTLQEKLQRKNVSRSSSRRKARNDAS